MLAEEAESRVVTVVNAKPSREVPRGRGRDFKKSFVFPKATGAGRRCH